MVKEAAEHATDDKKRRELVETRKQADAMIHSTEKTLTDLGDKVPAGEKSAIEAAMAELKTALAGEDPEAIKAKLNTLAQVSMKLGEAMYKQAGSGEGGGPDAAGGAAPGGGKTADPGVVDADFEEVKDDKKKSA